MTDKPDTSKLFSPEPVYSSSKDGSTWQEDFKREGWAIIKGVVTPERAEYYRQKQIEWLQSFKLGFDPKDESTYTQEHLPVSFKGGMYMGYASSHEKFVWESRMEPGIKDVFKDLWKTDELICSFDGMNITLPRQKDLKWSPWPHCDQNPNKKGMHAVQGLLNYSKNGPKDGGLILMTGSANLYDQFFEESRVPDDHEDAPPPEIKYMDLFIFNQKHVKWYEERGCKLIKTCLEPGDFVIWDSRTLHYAAHPQGDEIRAVQYICMTPRSMGKQEDLEYKAKLFNEWQGTTHWPHCNIRPTGLPLRDGQTCPHNRTEPLERPVITDELLRLAAVKAY